MTERDKRISDQLVRLVQIIFGIVLAQSLLLYRDVVVQPFLASHLVSALALITIYVTTVLSWIDWHVTMELRPYNFNARNVYRTTEELRLGFDLLIVTIYAYMLFTVEGFKQQPSVWIGGYLLGFCIVFAAYLLSGLARRITHGKLASNPAPIIWTGLAYIALYALYDFVYRRASGSQTWINAVIIMLGCGIMIGYRFGRAQVVKRRRDVKKAGLVVAIDIDGVLADQIHGIIPKIRSRLGVDLTYDKVTEWRLALGDTDIAKEIAVAFEDSDYVLGMPVHKGARELVDAVYPKNTVVLLTARPLSTKASTSQWLENHGFTFDSVENVKEEKKSLYGSDVLVDDYIGNITEYLTHAQGTAILVSQPWNHQAPTLLADWIPSNRLRIAKDLHEARKIILTLQRERRVARTPDNAGRERRRESKPFMERNDER